MECAKIPKELVLIGNLSENWRKFLQSFEIYLKASGNDDKPDELKVAIVLNVIGEKQWIYLTHLVYPMRKVSVIKL